MTNSMKFSILSLVLLLFSCSNCDENFCSRKFQNKPKCHRYKNRELLSSNRTDLKCVHKSRQNFDYDLNRAYNLHCCFYSYPYCPRITWLKDGEKINNNDLLSNGNTTLKIQPKETSQGKYTCIASTPYGKNESYSFNVALISYCEERNDNGCEVDTNILKNRTVPLYIYDATAENNEVDEHHYVDLACCFLAKPYCPNIKWFHNDKPVEHNSFSQIINGGNTLRLYASPRTEGKYTCTATTPYNEFISYHMAIKVTRSCQGNFTVQTSPANRIVFARKGAKVNLQWNFICDGRLDSLTLWCGNDSITLTGKDKYYNLSRINFDKENTVTRQVTMAISNFQRSENITCKILFENNPSATFMLVEDVSEQPTRVLHHKTFFQKTGMWIMIGALCAVMVAAFVLVVFHRKKLKKYTRFFYPRNEQDETAALFDAFISYSEADGGRFVRTVLIPLLEDECGYKLTLHFRDFAVGKAIVDSIVSSIYDSRRIVTIITSEFLKSEWCKFEVDQGLRCAIKKPNRLVVVMLQDIPKNKLPKSLRSFMSHVTYLVWDDHRRNQMREKLKKALGPPLTKDETMEDESEDKSSLNESENDYSTTKNRKQKEWANDEIVAAV
ncbi:uncharacterized protein LOC124445761 isoform X2 [Xenia sp. Carnegie-2017]|nr:uncharacterized protein LOC124445761 isoform X2 [Xenia sp. Carnegie-2017]XP_046852472.1 uncharacterized protein LOC124445761 isoform X2 [Xenia sp. Carnegie-2017]XP_046852473.1 uncharacterized protein LOC124445761 isoform X2 [Xenia sp. Carnegie-2017]